MDVKIRDTSIGDGHPCYITFEAGPTHDGLDTAKRLVKLAAGSGADAVKFQIFDVDELIADKKLDFSYDVLLDKQSGERKTVTEPLYDILKRRCMRREEWIELKAYCDELDIAFFSTVADQNDIDLLGELGCDSIKIASGDVNYNPLLRIAAGTGAVIQLDTGNATLDEIEKAVNVITKAGNDRIIIHNCPSGYPAKLESINLRLISALKSRFGFPVGYSDHTPGHDMDVAAVAMGANLVEKTITEDRTIQSVEHIMSLEPDDMANFVSLIRDVEVAMGSDTRTLTEKELESRKKIRRSAYLTEDTPAGTSIKDIKLKFQRPGFGLSPDQLEELSNKKVKQALSKGHLLEESDLEI